MAFDILLLIVLAMNVYVLIRLAQGLQRLTDALSTRANPVVTLVPALNRLADAFTRWSQAITNPSLKEGVCRSRHNQCLSPDT